jgi:outer membrane immunogenic protein
MAKPFLPVSALYFLSQLAAASAADLPMPRFDSEPPQPIQAQPRWTGFYLGFVGGYATGNANINLTPSPLFMTINPSPAMFDFVAANGKSTLGSNGLLLGFQGGYKVQVQDVVGGIEADWSHLGIKGSSASGLLLAPDGMTHVQMLQSASLSQMASIRAITGVSIGSFLPYVTGGLGIGWISFSQAMQVPTMSGGCLCWTGDTSRAQVGWVLGGGIEYAVDSTISAKLEYLYSDFGSLQFITRGATNGYPRLDLTHSARFNSQVVRVGLNFRL